MFGSYNAADLTKYNRIPTNARISEDRVLKQDYYKILSAASHVHRNSPIAEAILQSVLSYVAPSGLTPVGVPQELLQIWRDWGNYADLSGTKNLDAIYHEIVREQIMGDCLVLLPAITDSHPISARIEVIPGGRVKNPKGVADGDKDPSGRTCFHGVAFSNQGVEMGYWIYRPESTEKEAIYCPRYNESGRLCAHLARRPGSTRAGQTRSLPLITPALQAIYDVDTITVATMERTKNQAKLGVFITTGRPADTMAGFGAANPQDGTPTLDAEGNPTVQGLGLTADFRDMVNVLPTGSEVYTAMITGGSELGEVFKSILLPISAAMNIPLPILLSSYADLNFSSGKLASQNLQRFVEFWNTQNGFLFGLIWRTVMHEATLRGMIPALTSAELFPTWIGSKGLGETNRKDTAEAQNLALANGTTTISQELAKEGQSFEAQLRQRAEEIATVKKIAAEFKLTPAELMPPITPAPTTKTPPTAPKTQEAA